MEFHEVSSILPPMSEEEYGALVDDIKKNGLIDPIVVHEGKIIDGATGIKPAENWA